VSHRRRMAIAAGNDVLEMEVRRRHRRGHLMHVTMSTIGLRDPSGRMTAFLGIFREVPERKAAEEERVS
jgi:PAS domain S-box-containing protein